LWRDAPSAAVKETCVRLSRAVHGLIVLFVAWASVGVGARPQSEIPPREQAAAVPDDSTESIEGEWTRWTEGRYRITPGDVLDISFPFVPELNQTVSVQPDGYVTLKDIADLRVQGRTLSQVRLDVRDAYAQFVREPVFTIVLKEFERPYFVANGQVEKPGRYELRGATTLTQALAIAGGTRRGANSSEIVIYRRFGEEHVTGRKVNVSAMYSKKDLAEDPLLRPGDTIVVPMSVLGKVWPVLELWRRW
jgi:polysaccharide export outer membrane protein